MPVEAPVSARGQKFDRFNLDVEAIGAGGERFRLPATSHFEVQIRPPHQLDEQVERLVDQLLTLFNEKIAVGRPKLTEALRAWTVGLGEVEAASVESLYAVRYHSRQFFSRLRIVTQEQAFAFESPCGPHEIRFDDAPLRIELEAVLVRAAATLDSHAHLGCYLLGWKPSKWAGLLKLLDKDVCLDARARAGILRAARFHEDWIEEARRLRNQIVHEGKFLGFKGVGHQGTEVLDAELNGVGAGALVVRIWCGLRGLTSELFQAFFNVAAPPM